MNETSTPGYALILPPGFVLVPAQGDVEADVRAVVQRHYEGVPLDDRTRGRVRHVERSLTAAVRSAKEHGVVDVVLPLGTPWKVPVSLALAFAPARRDGGPPVGPASTIVTTRAGDARREEIGPSAGAPDLDLPGGTAGGTLRTVHHVWESPSPDVPYLVGTFTVSGDRDPELAPMVDALTELGDTIMSSLRWRDAHAEPSPAPEAVKEPA